MPISGRIKELFEPYICALQGRSLEKGSPKRAGIHNKLAFEDFFGL